MRELARGYAPSAGVVGELLMPVPRDLVHDRRVDTDAVVVAPVQIVVALIGAAKLEQVVAMQMAHAVAQEVVVTIPEALADVLRIDVVGNQRIGQAFAADFNRSTQIRRTAADRPAWTTARSCADS